MSRERKRVANNVQLPQCGGSEVFAHRGATKMFLFVFPTIVPLRKVIWELLISLFIHSVIGTMQKL